MFALGEAVGGIAGFDDCAVMRDVIQEGGCHFGIAEDRDPFPELQIGGYDDTGLLVELADQMEEQRAAGLGERDVVQLVDDDAVQGRELPDDLPGIAFGLFLPSRDISFGNALPGNGSGR